MIDTLDPMEVAASPASDLLPEHISPTSARNYLSCSLRFWFEKLSGIRKATSPALHNGKAIHAALQAFHLARWRGTDDSPDTIAKASEGAFTALEWDEGPVSYPSAVKREEARLAGLRVVAAYLDSPEALSEKPRGVEVRLSERLPGLSVALTGAMDLVRGNLVPVDFKSAAAKPNGRHAAFDHELQLVSYQLLIEAATGESPPSLELVFLVKTKTPAVIRVSVPKANRQRKARVVRMLETAVRGIVEGRFHPQPGMGCMSCQFRNECLRWNGVIQ